RSRKTRLSLPSPPRLFVHLLHSSSLPVNLHLSARSRQSSRMLRVAQHAARLGRPALTRGMALEGTKFADGEKAIEDRYFTKEDSRIMAKLMAKVKEQSDIADKHAAEGVKAAELSALKQITAKYNISKEDVDKLVKWKHTHY
ncbi:hypothetical protein TSOC_012569, partial [Tetrabaena socialis]